MQIFNPPKLTTYHELQDMKPTGITAVVVIDYNHKGVPEEESDVAIYGFFDMFKVDECMIGRELRRDTPGAVYLKTGTE